MGEFYGYEEAYWYDCVNDLYIHKLDRQIITRKANPYLHDGLETHRICNGMAYLGEEEVTGITSQRYALGEQYEIVKNKKLLLTRKRKSV